MAEETALGFQPGVRAGMRAMAAASVKGAEG